MLLTSTVSMKCWAPWVKRPRPVGVSFALSSRSQTGWVKSPVPTTVIPLSPHHAVSVSTSISRLVARLNFEWRCRSAMTGMSDGFTRREPSPLSHLHEHAADERLTDDRKERRTPERRGGESAQQRQEELRLVLGVALGFEAGPDRRARMDEAHHEIELAV